MAWARGVQREAQRALREALRLHTAPALQPWPCPEPGHRSPTPVSNDQHRSVFHGPVQGLLHNCLAVGIQRRRRLVQQQHGGPPHQRPRDGYPLLLPAAAGKVS